MFRCTITETAYRHEAFFSVGCEVFIYRYRLNQRLHAAAAIGRQVNAGLLTRDDGAGFVMALFPETDPHQPPHVF